MDRDGDDGNYERAYVEKMNYNIFLELADGADHESLETF